MPTLEVEMESLVFEVLVLYPKNQTCGKSIQTYKCRLFHQTLRYLRSRPKSSCLWLLSPVHSLPEERKYWT